jgi:hypothetical protein
MLKEQFVVGIDKKKQLTDGIELLLGNDKSETKQRLSVFCLV